MSRIGERLFVYGTLRHGSPHPMARLLRGSAVHLGSASFKGKLYAVADYPGVVRLQEGETEESLVWGDVYLLTDAATVLRVLDEFEGAIPQTAEASDKVGKEGLPSSREGESLSREYERVKVRVEFQGGDEIECWIYLYLGPLEGLQQVKSGDWNGCQ